MLDEAAGTVHHFLLGDRPLFSLVWTVAMDRSVRSRYQSFFASALSVFAGTPTTVAPGSTSLVTTLPAPVVAPSPTVTGATSIVSEPILTRSPICVSCLFLPS